MNERPEPSREVPDSGVDRVLAGRETRGDQSVDPQPAEQPLTEPADQLVYPPPARARKTRTRIAVITLAVAAVAALVAVLTAGGSQGGSDPDLPQVDRPGESVALTRSWSPMGLPTLDVHDPNATPAPKPTPTSSPSASPTPPVDGPADTQPPSTPGGFMLSDRSSTALSVRWDAATDDIGVAAYEVFLNDRRIETTASTSAQLNGLVTATTYTVSVRAVDAAGNAGGRTALSATTVDSVAPSAPPGVEVGDRSGEAIALTWRAARDNVGVAAYVVYLDGREVSRTSDTSATVGGLAPATKYTLSVAAIDAAGNLGPRAAVSGSTLDTVAPSAPPSVSVDQHFKFADISWATASDNVRVTGYVVYVDGQRYGTTSLQALRIEGLTAGTEYTVGVAAVDASGNVGGQVTRTFSTLAPP